MSCSLIFRRTNFYNVKKIYSFSRTAYLRRSMSADSTTSDNQTTSETDPSKEAKKSTTEDANKTSLQKYVLEPKVLAEFKTEASLKAAEQLDKIPAEFYEGPRKEVFHQFKNIQNDDPVYTIEQAAQPGESESFMRYYKYQYLSNKHSDYHYFARSHQNEYSLVHQFPEVTDFLIVGSGLVGSATAYYLKRKTDRVLDVCVADRDPYSINNVTAICSGLLSNQTACRETFRMSTLSKELIRLLQNDVVCTAEDFATIKYRPCTHLILWREEDVGRVVDSINGFMDDGCLTETKLPCELEEMFPWLKVSGSDVALGSHGNQDEAIIDPIALRNLYRTLAQARGANFIVGDAIDFNTVLFKGISDITEHSASNIVFRIPSTKELKSVGFGKTLLSCGHNVAFLEQRSDMDPLLRTQIEDMHFLQPRLRVCIHFHSFSTPVINFPALTDTDGSLLITDDYGGNFKYYLPYKECDDIFEDDMNRFMDFDSENPYLHIFHRDQMFANYFQNVIKPRLVKRIPSMEDAAFDIAYTGFENYNTYDASPVMGIHPFHSRIMLSGGYGSRLMTFAPAAAASFCELMLAGEEETFDLTNFYWNRALRGRKIDELEILLQ